MASDQVEEDLSLVHKDQSGRLAPSDQDLLVASFPLGPCLVVQEVSLGPFLTITLAVLDAVIYYESIYFKI